MGKGIKRRLAVLFAAVIVVSVCLFLPASSLWASDGNDAAIETGEETDELAESKHRTQEIIIPANPAIEEPAGASAAEEAVQEISVNEEIPLSNSMIDEYNYCVLHFVLMLAAFFVFVFYIKSMKRQQERIRFLRAELEKETKKRVEGYCERSEQ